MRSDDVSRMNGGRWVRRGREIILLGDPGAPAGALEEETGIPGSVIHPAIDVHAQHALTRMLKAGSDAGAEARAMVQAVSKGTLAGIYKVDQQVPALRAKAMGIGWWQLIPAGQGAAVVPDPAGQGAPIIAFASSLVARLPELETMLRRAWASLLRGVVGPARRLRLSVWAPHESITAGNLARGAGLIDDVSLLRTMTFDPDRSPLTLTWDPLGAGDQAAHRPLADLCHSLGIQALAGFSIVPEGAHKAREERIAQRFNDWLMAETPTPAFGVVARAMADRAQQCGFDGISVDVETLGCDAGPRFSRFCRTLAAELRTRSMWLAVAVTPKINGLVCVPCFSRSLEFGMGDGSPNLVIRPMGYSTLGPMGEERHRAILDHALVTHSVPPAQVQLGLHNVPGETGSLSRGEIVRRCLGLLRPRNVGLVMFYLRRGENWDDWAAYERAMNHDALVPAPRPPRSGEPLQAPLDAVAMGRLGRTSGTVMSSLRAARPRPLVARR